MADAAARAVEFVGLPEAQLNLAHAVVHLATAPKSNRVTIALGRARADVREQGAGEVPNHLRDAHYQGAKSLGHGDGLRLPPRRPDGAGSTSSTGPTSSRAASTTSRPTTATRREVARRMDDAAACGPRLDDRPEGDRERRRSARSCS